MSLGVLLSAIGLFVATNIDDLFMLSLFFARGEQEKGSTWRIVFGQYLGFSVILGLSVATALGMGVLLPPAVIPFFGLIPLGMGLWAIWTWWRDRDSDEEEQSDSRKIGVLTVAAVSFAHGGNNLALYVSVFVNITVPTMLVYCAIFLVLDGGLLWLSRFVARRPPVARVFHRWEHILYPATLIIVGLYILAGVFA